MPIVSYAQNLEDVLLWRALQHVGRGVYVDVGAQDPIVDSVSKCFYEQGWRGIHVEPTSQYAELLRQDRPDEIVLEAAVSERPGRMTFYVIPDTGQSTAVKEIAENAGRASIEMTVAALTLDQVFAKLSSKEVHWLKIDVEGSEHAVLKGWRKACRPWVVVVEATSPLTQIVTHKEWEHLLLRKNYSFVHFDGLNRYYVSAAHKELKKHFRHGPTIWDEYQLLETSSRTIALRQHQKESLDRARTEAEASIAREAEATAQAKADVDELHGVLEQVRGELAQVRSELGQAHDEHDKARGEVEQAHADLGEVRRELEAMRGDLSRAQGELSQTRGALDQTRSELDLMRGVAERAKSGLEQACSEVAQARAELDQMQSALDRAIDEARRTEGALAQARSELEQACGEHGQTRGELSQARDALDRINAEARARSEHWTRQRARRMAEIAAITGSSSWLAGRGRIALSVEELLSLHDEAFVRCTYATVLGREPDPDGLHRYLARVRNGECRLAIVAEIRLSPEGQEREELLPGLDRAIRSYRLRRLPLIGPLLRWSGGDDERSDVQSKLAAIESQLELLARLAPHLLPEKEQA